MKKVAGIQIARSTAVFDDHLDLAGLEIRDSYTVVVATRVVRDHADRQVSIPGEWGKIGLEPAHSLSTRVESNGYRRTSPLMCG